MISRAYDPDRDQDALRRLWEEIGWIERDERQQQDSLDQFLRHCRNRIAELNGQAECLVSCCDASIRHLNTEIPLSVVAAVTTSLLARKQGLASHLTALSVAAEAAAGMPLSALGMFEQGYYSRLGFGTGPYEHIACFNPAELTVPGARRAPERLQAADFEAMHQALSKRWRGHGGVNLAPAAMVKAEIGWTEDPMGLGFRDKSGELTHFVWGSLKGENGPLKITALAYRDRQQLLELLGCIKNLGDQVYLVRLIEPAQLQLQDLLRQPFRGQNKSKGGEFEERIDAEAFWQLRINDLPVCLAHTHLHNRSGLAFNLELEDPIQNYLDADQPWRGISGDYVVRLGENCSAEPGRRQELPTLQASVGGFSRLWLGAASATAITISGELSASDALLQDLQDCLNLPLPRTGWEF